MKSRVCDPTPQTTIGGIAATPPSPPYRAKPIGGYRRADTLIRYIDDSRALYCDVTGEQSVTDMAALFGVHQSTLSRALNTI